MRIAFRALAVAVLAALAAALATPCASARLMRWPHGELARQASPRGGASHHDPASDADAQDGWAAVLTAPCACGCDQRPEAPSGVIVELTHSLVSRPPRVATTSRQHVEVPTDAARIPVRPAAIDHVPLVG